MAAVLGIASSNTNTCIRAFSATQQADIIAYEESSCNSSKCTYMHKRKSAVKHAEAAQSFEMFASFMAEFSSDFDRA